MPEVSSGARMVETNETTLRVPAIREPSPVRDGGGSGELDDTASPTTLRHVRACMILSDPVVDPGAEIVPLMQCTPFPLYLV